MRPWPHNSRALAELTFGVCAVLFGGAHFFYMNLTVPLVPKFLPPSQLFWAYATGIGHIAAGLAILTGVQARLAAIILTVMYGSFTPLVHVPNLLAGHASQFIWSENAENIALTGCAWVVADSLARRSAEPGPEVTDCACNHEGKPWLNTTSPLPFRKNSFSRRT